MVQSCNTGVAPVLEQETIERRLLPVCNPQAVNLQLGKS